MSEYKIYSLHMGKAKCAVDLGDGSERGEYVNQDYILNKMGRPHRSISLMYCYYPLDKEFPGRISEVMKDEDVSFAWDYPYDDYFTYKGGEIFVLDMGAPVKIDTLARNLIRLSGYKPDVDIKIVYSGLRPGEKLFEEKLMAEEGMMKTDNELIHIGKPIPFDTETFLGQLGELARASYNNDENIVEMVEKIVPTFSPVGDKPTGNEKYGRNDVAVSAAK